MKHDVITFGSATQDVFLTSKHFKPVQMPGEGKGMGECFALGEKFEVDGVVFDTGGGGANTASTFSQLGFRSAIVSRVGQDASANIVVDSLREKNISVDWLVRDKKHSTCYSTILLTPQGERTILVYRGASRVFSTKDVPWGKLSAGWFYVATVAGNVRFLRKIFQRAKQSGARVAFNPGSGEIGLGLSRLLPLIKRCDYFQLNKEEAGALLKLSPDRLDRILSEFQKIDLPLVVVTDGKAGAYLITRDAVSFVSPPSHTCINATGAGDAFGSGFVAGIIYGLDPLVALKVATINGSCVVEKMGAQKGLLKSFPSSATLKKVKCVIV